MADERFGRKDYVWIVYNHMPYGHINSSLFRTTKRRRRRGDAEEEITATAEEQIRGFEKSDFVALYKGKKFEKNKVLVYPDSLELVGNPQAGAIVLEWAKKEGVEVYDVNRPKTFKPEQLSLQMATRIESLESSQKATADAIASLANSQNALARAIESLGGSSQTKKES